MVDAGEDAAVTAAWGAVEESGCLSVRQGMFELLHPQRTDRTGRSRRRPVGYRRINRRQSNQRGSCHGANGRRLCVAPFRQHFAENRLLLQVTPCRSCGMTRRKNRLEVHACCTCTSGCPRIPTSESREEILCARSQLPADYVEMNVTQRGPSLDAKASHS